MSNSFPNRGAMPSQQGYALSSSTGAAAAQQGMVRIHRGGEVRYVWPVHLAGWLSSGWRTGEENRSPQGAGDAVDTVVISAAPGRNTALPVAMGTSPASTDPSLTPVAESDEPAADQIDAHLPTNLLDLDLEPEAHPPEPTSATTTSEPSAEAPQQQGIEPNDAEPASFAAPATTEPPQKEPTPTPAPARRGRPRKVRPEPQAEPAHEPAAVTPAQEQASPSQDSGEQQDAATVLTSEGDDPFGLDPLL